MPFSHRFLMASVAVLLLATELTAADNLRLLIVDGQNNHNWQVTTPILVTAFERQQFDVDVATSPPRGAAPDAWKSFQPAFADYDVVLSNYNGELWPEAVRQSLESYVADGGGLLVVHAANNAFPEWDAWNQMIGLGWRNANYGARVSLDETGRTVRSEKGTGPGAGHGRQHEFSVILRDRKHPIMDGLPAEWMHAQDELYHGQRGPAAGMHLLATAYSSPESGGTGAHEPMVWWIPFGEGRVVTNVMGHSDVAMRCVGFQTILLRSAEWVAKRPVTIEIPAEFPSPEAALSVAE